MSVESIRIQTIYDLEIETNSREVIMFGIGYILLCLENNIIRAIPFDVVVIDFSKIGE